MDLDRQIQELIENAPQDGTTPTVVAAIAPVLQLLAQQLKHLQYYVLQTLDERWATTTLSNTTQPELEKTVIYAFPTLQDASDSSYSRQDPQVMAIPVPVAHILFQMVAMETIHSIVFFEQPGNLSSGIEVRRADVQNLIQSHLQQLQSTSRSRRQQIPPNLA